MANRRVFVAIVLLNVSALSVQAACQNRDIQGLHLVAGGSDTCTLVDVNTVTGLQMSTSDATTCTVQCDVTGYEEKEVTLTCAQNAATDDVMSATVDSTAVDLSTSPCVALGTCGTSDCQTTGSTLKQQSLPANCVAATCTETECCDNTCANLEITDMNLNATSTGCTISGNTVTGLSASSSCNLECDSGYVATAVILTCAANAANNAQMNATVDGDAGTLSPSTCVGCPTVENGNCVACSNASTCTAVTCDVNHFDSDETATNGCEVGCPPVTDGTCTACSDASTCTAVACDANRLNSDLDAKTGCEFSPPDLTGYAASPAVYTEGNSITANAPTFTGTLSNCTIDRDLPAGLAFSETTCMITGRPTQEVQNEIYTISASNAAGVDETPFALQITVTSADLSELTLLAAAADDDVDLAVGVLANLGWTPGIAIADPTPGAIDHAWTFSKHGKCLAVFAASNDDTDYAQAFQGLIVDPVDFCGFTKLHYGVVQELRGFMNATKWKPFIDFLNGAACTTSVTAVGHSLGGSVASLFAACANRALKNADNFGARSDYGLVVFAPFAVSKDQLYSGTAGTPFVGTRYGITEGNSSKSHDTEQFRLVAGLPDNTKQFRLDILTLCRDVSAAMNDTTSATLLNQTLFEWRAYTEDVVEAKFQELWTSGEPLPQDFLVKCGLQILNFAKSQTGGALLAQIFQTVQTMSLRGDLTIEYDPVNSFTTDFGFRHALVDFQPLAAPTEDVAYPTLLASDPGVTALPKADFFQNLFSNLALRGHFVNHQICCYSTADQCASKFTVGWKACSGTGASCVEAPVKSSCDASCGTIPSVVTTQPSGAGAPCAGQMYQCQSGDGNCAPAPALATTDSTLDVQAVVSYLSSPAAKALTETKMFAALLAVGLSIPGLAIAAMTSQVSPSDASEVIGTMTISLTDPAQASNPQFLKSMATTIAAVSAVPDTWVTVTVTSARRLADAAAARRLGSASLKYKIAKPKSNLALGLGLGLGLPVVAGLGLGLGLGLTGKKTTPEPTSVTMAVVDATLAPAVPVPTTQAPSESSGSLPTWGWILLVLICVGCIGAAVFMIMGSDKKKKKRAVRGDYTGVQESDQGVATLVDAPRAEAILLPPPNSQAYSFVPVPQYGTPRYG